MDEVGLKESIFVFFANFLSFHFDMVFVCLQMLMMMMKRMVRQEINE